MQKQSNCEFIIKLIDMMEEHPDQVVWSESGSKIIFRNMKILQLQILPRYFRHQNLASFIRQLNMYGFGQKQNLKEGVTFTHEIFKQGNQQNFFKIKRKSKKKDKIHAQIKFKKQNQQVLEKLKLHRNFPYHLESVFSSMLLAKSEIKECLTVISNEINKITYCFKQTKQDKISDLLQQINQIILYQFAQSLQQSKQIKTFIVQKVLQQELLDNVPHQEILHVTDPQYQQNLINRQQQREIPEEIQVSSNISFFRFQNDSQSLT